MIFTHILAGFVLAFTGFVAPAMLNMTTVRTTIEKGKSSGIFFGTGAASVNAIHGLIALSFANHLTANPNIIFALKHLGVVILFGLAYFFFKKSKKQIGAGKELKKMHPFNEGLLMSSLNMLAIPYYFTTGLGLQSGSTIILEKPFPYYLTIGIFLGGITVFSIYTLAAETIAKRSQFFTKNINLILTGIFVLLGIIVGSNLIYHYS